MAARWPAQVLEHHVAAGLARQAQAALVVDDLVLIGLQAIESSNTTPAPSSMRTLMPASSGRAALASSMNSGGIEVPVVGAAAPSRRRLRQFDSDTVLTRSRSQNACWLRPLCAWALSSVCHCAGLRWIRRRVFADPWLVFFIDLLL